MFVAIVRFPKIKTEQDEEFREWFNWSTQLLSKSPGFISRRLLVGKESGYVAIVEHKGFDTFMAMRSTNEHKLAHERATELFNGVSKMEFFEVISN